MAKKLSQLPADLRRNSTSIVKKIVEIFPDIIKVEGLNHFEESWDNQGFTDRNVKKWQKRKAPDHQTNKDGTVSKSFKKWNLKDAGRALLISHKTDTKGAHLKDSLKATKTKKQVIFSTDKEYAEPHNEGGQSGRGAGFIMPQRQFMGPSKVLDKKIEQKLTREITKFLKNLK